jgi:hypothetical protein
MAETFVKWSPDEIARRSAKKLFRVEIIYFAGSETKRAQEINMLPEEFMKLRENLVQCGIAMPARDFPGHGFVILPQNVVSVEYWVQDSFIDK